MTDAYLSIGSNTGKRKTNLRLAYKKISKLGKALGSHIYKTEPWGRNDLSEFLNACVYIKTDANLIQLFKKICYIEDEMGRKREEKWGSRIIDIDILISNQLIFISPELIVPHPYLNQRNFYLEPLAEIAKEEIEPITGRRIKNLLADCQDTKGVWKTGNTLQ
jgi:2-amino-4-hydroxy-6-hydroxymethyldihydropteridine diphosphokinase